MFIKVEEVEVKIESVSEPLSKTRDKKNRIWNQKRRQTVSDTYGTFRSPIRKLKWDIRRQYPE